MSAETVGGLRRAERAAVIALACFYAVGLGAHLFAPTRRTMVALTPPILLAGGTVVLAAAVRSATAPRRLLAWSLLTAAGTFAAEVAGVGTGAVFGPYLYGDALGRKLLGVPPVIGFNWTLTVLGSLLLAERWAPPSLRTTTGRAARAALHAVSTGLLAVLFDLALEPTAAMLGYWSWTGGAIPLRNYAAWFVLSALSALLYRALRVRVTTSLPVFYLAVQWLFFLGIDLALARVSS